jgi:two-component system sensor histidine kinase KdpD
MMNSPRVERAHVAEAAGWLILTALATAGMLSLRDRAAATHVAFVYLLLVLGASARRGRVAGLITAAAAFLAFNFFFVEPYGTFFVHDPLDWVVLLGFLMTSLVAAQLLHLARAAAQAELLRETDRMKDALLAAVSHDLRTPLTTIKAVAHEIASDGEERAADIATEADRLNRYVTNLLELSRAHAGSIVAKPEPVPLDDLIGSALHEVSAADGDRKVTVHFGDDWTTLVARCDYVLTMRIVANLVENAVRYAPDGPIDIDVSRAADVVHIRVLDRGPGVSADDVGRVFQPFQRARSAPGAAGTGLGLTIGRLFAETQGGSVTYEPREGGGAAFMLSLPAVPVAELAGDFMES